MGRACLLSHARVTRVLVQFYPAKLTDFLLLSEFLKQQFTRAAVISRDMFLSVLKNQSELEEKSYILSAGAKRESNK